MKNAVPGAKICNSVPDSSEAMEKRVKVSEGWADKIKKSQLLWVELPLRRRSLVQNFIIQFQDSVGAGERLVEKMSTFGDQSMYKVWGDTPTVGGASLRMRGTFFENP